MKKIITGTLFLALCLGLVWGQTAHVTRLQFPKIGKVDALTISFNGDAKNVEDVLAEKVQRETGEKPKNYKSGYKMVSGVKHRSISSQSLDLYYQVDKEGTKENPQAKVSVVMSMGNESFMEEARFPDEFRAARDFLEELPRETQMYELSLLIDEQQKTLSKNQKDYEKAGQDSLDLVITLQETQQAIEDNKVLREQQRLLLQENEALLEEHNNKLEETRGIKKD